jgi:hypothetical protein
MTVETRITRRQVLQAVISFTPIAMNGCMGVQQPDKPLLNSADPTARTLGYYANSNAVPSDHPLATTHQPNQTCATCVNSLGAAGEGFRNCPKFPGRLVYAKGWCSLWTKI